jgi:hypothetical protein
MNESQLADWWENHARQTARVADAQSYVEEMNLKRMGGSHPAGDGPCSDLVKAALSYFALTLRIRELTRR